jgi:hypothetical protein
MTVQQMITIEMAAYAQSRKRGDVATAWRALERAHIMSQPYLGLHVTNHWTMLTFAISERDMKEVLGQIFRLALAPLGAISGRIPTGNTGRSNIGAFVPMDIPEDIRAKMQSDKL